MGVAVLRERCRDMGISLRVTDAGALRFDAAPGLVTPELRAELVEHRAALADLLTAETAYVAAGERIDSLTDAGRTEEARAIINGEYAEVGDRMAAHLDGDFWAYIAQLCEAHP